MTPRKHLQFLARAMEALAVAVSKYGWHIILEGVRPRTPVPDVPLLLM